MLVTERATIAVEVVGVMRVVEVEVEVVGPVEAVEVGVVGVL